MKFIIILFSTILISITGQVRNPFSELKYDRVVMYDFAGGKGSSDVFIINDKGQLAKTVINQVQLNKETISSLSKRLGQEESYGGVQAACFDPHLGFVYYDHGKVVAHISICLDCNVLHSSVDIPAQMQGKTGRGNNVYYLGGGLSKSFRQFLNGLLVVNKFSHQLKE